jgi:hypothetical protein
LLQQEANLLTSFCSASLNEREIKKQESRQQIHHLFPLNLTETPPARQKNPAACAGLANNLRQALGLTFVYDCKPDITTVSAGGVKIR